MTDDPRLRPRAGGAKELQNVKDIIPNNLLSLPAVVCGLDPSSLRLCVLFIYLFIHCYQARLNRFNRPGH